MMPCKFCKNRGVAGVFYYDLKHENVRVCWKAECRRQYDLEQKQIRFRDRAKLRSEGKCWYIDIDGICEHKAAIGQILCVMHLMKRCVMCGFQATHTCVWSGTTDCKAGLCDDHLHDHTKDPTCNRCC